MAGVLKAKVGGQWVPIVGSGMSAETARWNSAWGIVARAKSASGSTTIPAGTAYVSLTTQVPVTLLSGRRYRISYNARAITANGGISTSLTFILANSGVNTTWFDQWRTAAMSNQAGYDGAIVDAIVDGDGVARLLDVRSAGSSVTPITIYDDPYSGLTIEDVGPVTPSASAPPNPTPAWTDVTFQNGWINPGPPPQKVQYRLIGDVVSIRGVMHGGTLNAVAFTLPVGLRPPEEVWFPTVNNGATGQAQIYKDGTFKINTGSTSWVALGNIAFSTTP